MESGGLRSIADEQFLYLTTTRNTGLVREIEIWFVVYRENFYLFAEMGEAAGWVKNIRRHPRVAVRIGEQRVDGSARILDRQADRELWDEAATIARQKYGWGEGLPVEITPLGADGCQRLRFNSQSIIRRLL